MSWQNWQNLVSLAGHQGRGMTPTAEGAVNLWRNMTMLPGVAAEIGNSFMRMGQRTNEAATQGRMFGAEAAGPITYDLLNTMIGGGPTGTLAAQGGKGTAPMWFHGTNRLDRLTKKGKLDPKRATSGPMIYFTDDPAIASNYAANKPDTSLMDTGEVASYFTVSPKALGHTRSRTPYTVEQSWHYLTPEQQATIRDRARRIGYANPEEASGPYTLHESGDTGNPAPSHYDYLMQTEARGNPLSALRAMWHDGGSLVGSEQELAEIYKLAGYPHQISQETAPWFTAPGILPAKMDFKTPLDTSNMAVLREEVIPKLREQFKGDRSRKKPYGADMWDKNTRFTPREWLDELEKDVAAGKNSFVWTSIPDKVSDALRKIGFDGIYDTGGKMGGQGHIVAIPLSPGTVRSGITDETLFAGGSPSFAAILNMGNGDEGSGGNPRPWR